MHTVNRDRRFSIQRRTKASLSQHPSIVENEGQPTRLPEESTVEGSNHPRIPHDIVNEEQSANVYVDNYQSDDDETSFDTSRPGAYAIRIERNAPNSDEEVSYHHDDHDEIPDNSDVQKPIKKKSFVQKYWSIGVLVSLTLIIFGIAFAIQTSLVTSPDHRKICDNKTLSTTFDPILSCHCFDVIQGMNGNLRLKYETIKDKIGGKDDDTVCTPINIAIWWVASTMKENSIHQKNLYSLQQKVALVSLYMALDGTHWKMNLNWLSNDTECNWYGVKCSSGGDIVVELSLNSNNMYGVIETSVGLLSGLTNLDFSHNYLSGSIPLEIWDFPILKHLNLSKNRFWGTIPFELDTKNHSSLLGTLDLNGNVGINGLFPSISLLSNAEIIRIGRTAMVGNLPWDLSQLTRLKSLELFAMDYISGMLPQIDALTSLENLLISLNSIQGQFSPNFRNLTLLENLQMNLPLSSGSIPEEIMHLSKLEYLNFAFTILTNSLPTELGKCHKMQSLSFANTQLSGSLPSELGNLRRLTSLSLMDSPNLSGNLPVEISNLPSLKSLDLTSTHIKITNSTLLCNRSDPVETIVDEWEIECTCCISG